jgi:hypothetical protein
MARQNATLGMMRRQKLHRLAILALQFSGRRTKDSGKAKYQKLKG